jgi:hypothetical protein
MVIKVRLYLKITNIKRAVEWLKWDKCLHSKHEALNHHYHQKKRPLLKTKVLSPSSPSSTFSFMWPKCVKTLHMNP